MLGALGGASSAAAAPVVTTGGASAVTSTSATIAGTIAPVGTLVFFHFEYGPWPGYGQSTPTKVMYAGSNPNIPVPVSANLTSLVPATTYHYRLVADNGTSASLVRGSDQLLLTQPPPPPVVTTGVASPVASDSATLKGTVNPSGFATSYHFEYGPNTSYGTSTPSTNLPAGNSAVAVSAPVSGLTPSSTYHFKLVADNGGGPVSGSDSGFITGVPPPPPTVVTGSPSNIGGTAALVAGTINPNGPPLQYHFEYGLDTTYGSSTPTALLPAGTSPVVVQALLVGLSPGTTYHYKLVAANGGSPVGGGDADFTTTSVTNVAPTSTTIDAGTPAGGNAGSLAATDGSYFAVNNGFSVSPLGSLTSWYGGFTGLPASPANLKVSYTGKNSSTCLQSIQIFRWATATWVTLDTRSVGTSDVAIDDLAAPGVGSQYVSGGAARVRVRCVLGTFTSFIARGNFLRISYG